MKINEFCEKAHSTAKDKGFWESEREVGTLLMLIVSELGEALEAHRKNKKANLEKYYQGIAYGDPFETYIKDSFEDEIADVFIRLFDLCGGLNINIETFIKLKMQYNETRKHKHGKNY